MEGIYGRVDAMDIDELGNVYIAGRYFAGSSLLNRSFPDPHPIWVNALGRYITLPYSFIAKINNNHTLGWVEFGKTTGCCVSNSINMLHIDKFNNLWVVGSIKSGISFENWGLTLKTYGNAFVLKVSADGALEDHNFFNKTGSYEVEAFSIGSDHLGNIYVHGSFSNDFIYDNYTLPFHGEGTRNGFLMKINNESQLSWIHALETNLAFTNNMDVDTEGNVWVVGNFSRYFKYKEMTIVDPRALYIAQINPDGDLRYFGNSKTAHYSSVEDVVAKSSSEVIVIGTLKDSLELSCNKLFDPKYVPFLTRIYVSDVIEQFIISGPEDICYGESLQFQSSTSDKVYRYNWTITDEKLNILLDTTMMHPEIITDTKRFPGINTFKTFLRGEYNCSQFGFALPITTQIHQLPGPLILDYKSDSICVEIEDVVVKALAHRADTLIWTMENDIIYTQYDKSDSENEITFMVPNDFQRDSISLSVVASNQCGLSNPETALLFPVFQINEPLLLIGPETICPTSSFMEFKLEGAENASSITWQMPTELYYKRTYQDPSSIVELVYNSSNRDNGLISATAENQCFKASSNEIKLKFDKPLSLPLISIDDCKTTISSSLRYGNSWFYNGNLMADTSQVIKVNETGTYYIKKSNSCEEVTSNYIEVDPIDIFVPNVFTPNGDDKNELFEIGTSLLGSELFVYNRYGGVVYHEPSYANNWNSDDLPSGVYFYYLRNACLEKPIKGTLSILK